MPTANSSFAPRHFGGRLFHKNKGQLLRPFSTAETCAKTSLPPLSGLDKFSPWPDLTTSQHLSPRLHALFLIEEDKRGLSDRSPQGKSTDIPLRGYMR